MAEGAGAVGQESGKRTAPCFLIGSLSPVGNYALFRWDFVTLNALSKQVFFFSSLSPGSFSERWQHIQITIFQETPVNGAGPTWGELCSLLVTSPLTGFLKALGNAGVPSLRGGAEERDLQDPDIKWVFGGYSPSHLADMTMTMWRKDQVFGRTALDPRSTY